MRLFSAILLAVPILTSALPHYFHNTHLVYKKRSDDLLRARGYHDYSDFYERSYEHINDLEAREPDFSPDEWNRPLARGHHYYELLKRTDAISKTSSPEKPKAKSKKPKKSKPARSAVSSVDIEPGRLTTEQKRLIQEVLEAQPGKISVENVITIFQVKKGFIEGVPVEIVWLEKGSLRGGEKHIWDAHGAEFTQKGITRAEIPRLLEAALTGGHSVGTQGTTKPGLPPRVIYEVTWSGKNLYLAISVGTNGFIVAMNPTSAPGAVAGPSGKT
ncbi:hypothetical protein BDQ17DRAFT_1434687 [Cyathus striatus]|nr:hypothetical protein BDQ17DRAFT_1434687 [Cyathus striatus]